MSQTFVEFKDQVCIITSMSAVADDGKTIQEYKGPSELYY